MSVSKSIVTEAELSLLNALWEQAPLTARELADRVYGNTRTATIGTVQKLISRLEKKEMVLRDGQSSTHRFETLLTREQIAGLQLEEFAAKLSAGSLSPFVAHLVQSRELTDAEKAEIRKILED